MAREGDPDLDVVMNADAKGEDAIPELLGQYFSLDNKLKPIGVSIALVVMCSF